MRAVQIDRFSEQDLGSPGKCDAGPAFLREFGRHRYVIVWDYLVIDRLNHVFIWCQSTMGTPFSKKPQEKFKKSFNHGKN
jgi:hypothetical protein